MKIKHRIAGEWKLLSEEWIYPKPDMIILATGEKRYGTDLLLYDGYHWFSKNSSIDEISTRDLPSLYDAFCIIQEPW